MAALAGTRVLAQHSPGGCSPAAISPRPQLQRDPPFVEAKPPSGLTLVADIPLPGPANRFDYQSIDSATRRLYINHMDAGRTVVVDLGSEHVVGEIAGVPRATGVLAVPRHHAVYISSPGSHQVAIADDRTLLVTHRVGSIRFPDGIAFAPDAEKVFVSDESGDAELVIDARTATKRSTIELGGEAGNTHYDPVSHCILVAVQTRNEMVAIDPVTERIAARYNLPGCEHPHGFAIDDGDRLAFVACDENAALVVLDLHSGKTLGRYSIADDPDVLAWDPEWRRLYVAAESGILSIWWLSGTILHSLGGIRAAHAHSVAVDVRTHRVYVPLENIGGKPVLRIFAPVR